MPVPVGPDTVTPIVTSPAAAMIWLVGQDDNVMDGLASVERVLAVVREAINMNAQTVDSASCVCGAERVSGTTGFTHLVQVINCSASELKLHEPCSQSARKQRNCWLQKKSRAG